MLVFRRNLAQSPPEVEWLTVVVVGGRTASGHHVVVRVDAQLGVVRVVLVARADSIGKERKLGASAQVERAGWCCRRSDSGMHTCCGRATVMVLVSQSSGLSEGGCPEQSRYFGPHPVRFKRSVVFVGVDGAAHRAWPFL